MKCNSLVECLVLVVAAGLLLAGGPGVGGLSAKAAGAEKAKNRKSVAGKAGKNRQPLKKPELLVQLPGDFCNTPDAMALLPDGNVVLSVPNFNDTKQPPVLVEITPDNKVEKFFELPPNPETGKPFGALGVCVAPSGDLFIADYQMEGPQKSRVCRIKMREGRPTELVPAVDGFNVSNAVICRNGYLYVTDTQIDKDVQPVVSGVFRIKLDEIGERSIRLSTPLLQDPRLIAKIQTFNQELPLGADGLCFDKAGNLYIGNFADGTVHRLTFDAAGKVTSNEIFAKADYMKSADGLFFDAQTDQILVADSKANAIHLVSLDGKVRILAQSGDTDGLDGGMDQPCEPLLRGREVIVSNMDWPVPGCINQKYDTPCTLSVIKLD
jgi:sugar lactone lactonase YvrE